MTKKTIAIIGGNQKSSFKKAGENFGVTVLFHDGITRNGGTKKSFKPLVKKADCVVVLLGACSHISMEMVKELCKTHNKKLEFHRGFGVTGALSTGVRAVQQEVV